MKYHRSIAMQLTEPSQKLNEFFSDPGLEEKFNERSIQLQQMIHDTKASQRRLALSAEHWSQYSQQLNQVNLRFTETNAQLQELLAKAQREKLGQEDCFHYWVMPCL